MEDLNRLSDFLSTKNLGRFHQHHPSTASTNELALNWASAKAPHGALVTADMQTAGRGRMGRTWFSSSGLGIYASLVLRPEKLQKKDGSAPNWDSLALAMGVGLCDGIRTWLPNIKLKWPNDVLEQSKKLAGILCEARWYGETYEVVAGFGINVHHDAFPEQLWATSFKLAGAAQVSRCEILASVLWHIEQVLDAYFFAGFSGIREKYEKYCPLVGQTLKIRDSVQGYQWVFVEEISQRGALKVCPCTGGPSFQITSTDLLLSTAPPTTR